MNSLRICTVPEARCPALKAQEFSSKGEGFEEGASRARGVGDHLLRLASDTCGIWRRKREGRSH